MRRRGPVHVSIVLAALAVLLLPIGSARPAVLAQSSEATLLVINESDQTICHVLIYPSTADNWGDDWLSEGETIPPGASRAFNLSLGKYNILLVGCGGELLLDERGFTIASLYELRFTSPDRCRSLSQEGAVLHHQARYRDALEKFQEALVCYRVTDDRKGEGAALNNIGGVYQSLGQYQEALGYFQEALAISRQIGDRGRAGLTLNNIGAVYYRQGQYQEALEYFHQALTIVQAVGDQIGEGRALLNLGLVSHRLGQYANALEYYNRALAIQRKIGDRAGEVVTLNNISGVYDGLGQYQIGLDTYRQALAIERAIGDRANEGNTLNNIGAVYYYLGQYQEALRYYEQALAIRQEISDRAGVGNTLHNIGSIYLHLKQYQVALNYLHQALVIAREVGDRAGEGDALNDIGGVYDSLGHYQQALGYYEQALAIEQEIGDLAGKGTALHNIGAIYDSLGQYQEAVRYYENALAIRQEIGDREGVGVTLNKLGCASEQQCQPGQALHYYERAMTVLEAVRATAGSEIGRSSFFAQYAGLYNRAVNLYHTQGQDDQAFFTTERGRARAFLDTMATGYVQLADDDAADLLTYEQETYAARQAAQDALSRARAQQPPDTTLIADLEARLTAAEQEHTAALAAIQERHNQLATLVPGRGAVLDLSQIQALLDDQTTLLSFWVLEEQTLVFVVTRTSFHTVALQIRQTELEAQTVEFRSFPSLDAAYPESAVALYTALIAPIREYLITPHLMIVPHNVLHYLPFGALTDGQHYLVDDYTITYLPSASVLPFIQENAGGKDGIPLILGNPAAGDLDTAVLVTERSGLGPLPYAEQEAQTIAVLYDTTPLLGAAATESVVQQRAGETRLLHLAAHGYYNPVAPLQSLIALAPDEANDGWLTVGEVYGLNLQGADLVVLSACESHLGDLSAGDELVGLTRALFYAGTPTVVASLWTVDDEATAQLMELFYTHLQAGMGKAEALRQAQLDIRADYPNPYYWAGFVLSGDGGKVEHTAVPIPILAWAGGGALLLALLSGGAWLWVRGRWRRSR